MIAVNGSAGSGVEAVLSEFHEKGRAIGERLQLKSIVATRKAMYKRSNYKVAEYEKYLDKNEPDSFDRMEDDVLTELPDGTWPILSLDISSIKLINKGLIAPGMAGRIGGSLFMMKPEDVERVLIVTCEPETLWNRRMACKSALRKLEAKYGASRVFRALIGRIHGEMAIVPVAIANEIAAMAGYVSEALRMFPDKVEFIDGSNSEISFNIDGSTIVRKQRNIRESDPRVTRRGPAGAPVHGAFTFKDYDDVRKNYDKVLSMVESGKPIDGLSAFGDIQPVDWFCARIRQFVNLQTCLKCVSTLGDSVFERAVPGWENEPCAYEVAYGPEPHKTIEKSVAEHSWNVLP